VSLPDGISDPLDRGNEARVVRLPDHPERSRKVDRPGSDHIHAFRCGYGIDFLESLLVLNQDCEQHLAI
jgi:hypothetical protein